MNKYVLDITTAEQRINSSAPFYSAIYFIKIDNSNN